VEFCNTNRQAKPGKAGFTLPAIVRILQWHTVFNPNAFGGQGISQL
jgi:hypothetical protein